jgi:DNA-binding response OmpR family regulator
MGTGIGLALVKELVDLYGGQISITSAQNEGTTFRLRLPYLASSFSADQIVTAEPSIHMPAYPLVDEGVHDLHEAPVTGEKSLILIVEDNPDLMQFIAENLSKEYDLLKAENGKKGLDKALAQVPDLIISDVMMPEMNGIELCNTLKTHDITSHIPIVLLTAKADRADKLEGLQHGADDYLTKPFDMRELKVRIHNLINQRQKLRDKFGATFKVGPSEVQLNSVDERFLNQVMEEIEKNMSNEFYTVEELAAAVNFSRSQLNRKIKALTGNTSNQLIRTFRLERAKEMLEQNAASVSEIAYAVGYANLSYFAKSFKEHFGVLPSEVKVRV